MTTTDKQQNEIENKIIDIFGKIYKDKNTIFVPLDDDKTKVNNIKKVKDYLNNKVNLYILEIVFTGGIQQEYKTALKIKVIK
mgnify:FL=1|tara:strand:- start:1637 stop:1882 length:246 start_codon:yes stop_codon:yes gene_type:complete